MIIDHVAAIWFSVINGPSTLRHITRLSMPLFCILSGYLLPLSQPRSWKRLGETGLVSLAVNAITYPIFKRIEILGSLIPCYLIHRIAPKGSWIMVAGILFYQVDPTKGILDYPLSLVATCVGVGMVYRRFGGWGGLAGVALAICGLDWVKAPDAHSIIAILPATGLLWLANRLPDVRQKALEFLGKWPLAIYLIQYYFIVAVYWIWIRRYFG